MKRSFKRILSIIAITVFTGVFSGFNPASYGQDDTRLNFKFADYASPGDLFYMETASFENLIKGLKEFYSSLRGDAGAAELNQLGTQVLTDIGINPIDVDSMKRALVRIFDPYYTARKGG